MGKYEPKTKITAVSVSDFIASVENDTRRQDARVLVRLFREVTGWKPRMWGPTIIGFGVYHYEYESGHSGSACATGFSPRKANLVIYVVNFPGQGALLKKLGKHKGGMKQCLYINKLADVDIDCLKEIVRRSLKQLKRRWPVAAT